MSPPSSHADQPPDQVSGIIRGRRRNKNKEGGYAGIFWNMREYSQAAGSLFVTCSTLADNQFCNSFAAEAMM
jgi:hypothetical protein